MEEEVGGSVQVEFVPEVRINVFDDVVGCAIGGKDPACEGEHVKGGRAEGSGS